MTYKIKSLFTNVVVILGVLLILSFVFKVLAYAIPIIFIIWLLKLAVNKIGGKLGTVHERRNIKGHRTVKDTTKTRNENIHIDRESETFNYFNLNNSKVVDVEFEEVNK